MMVEVGDPGMQAQECLGAFPPLEPLLLSFLSPCGSVFLQGGVGTAGGGDHLLVVNVGRARDLPNRGPGAPELIGMDDLWDIGFFWQPDQEGVRGLGMPMRLKEDVEHEPVLIHGPPYPMPDAVHACTHLVEMPPGTPTGFPVAQVFCEEGCELDTPFAEGLLADLNPALVQEFLHVPVTQGKSVIQPDSVLDESH